MSYCAALVVCHSGYVCYILVFGVGGGGGGGGGEGGLGPRPWLDTSARCMGLVVGRFHKNVLSEGGGFFIQGLLWFFLWIPPCCHHEEFEQK